VPHGRTGRRLTSAMSFKMARKRTFLEVRVGSIASPAASHFQPPPINGHRQSGPVGPFRAISGLMHPANRSLIRSPRPRGRAASPGLDPECLGGAATDVGRRPITP
jgi:hypothetical protein